MEYRMLGRTGIKVSAIGIGGEGFENKSYKKCEVIIDCAMNEGIDPKRDKLYQTCENAGVV